MARKTDLDGRTWLSYSISVWDDLRKTAEETGLSHPALYPLQLASRLIEIFSHSGETVLDPFCGTGTSILAAHNLNRRGIGLDISEEFLSVAETRLQNAGHDGYILRSGDARQAGTLVSEPVDFCVTSPPYWDILNQKRTADHKNVRHYGNLSDDLGTISCYDEFITALVDVFRGVYSLLSPGGYCCIVVMDLRKKDRFYPLHMDLSQALVKVGYTLDDMIVWDRRHEYNRLRPLGYPYVFRVNRVHEYVLILQKRQ
ncbi:MAG: DNA methyltransferase [Bacillota bacterium]|nr:DNA methyltransferase [Bacillota bacterium]MDW7683988.1 DNA methyltransferase [Bacillota bacterium]